MSDTSVTRDEQQRDDEGRETFDRLMEERPEPSLEVAAALRELEASRIVTAEALDELTGATQSALDFPAKIRRNPVKTAALVGGAGFLLARGPRRVARAVGRKVRPPRRRPDPYEGLMPPQIEKVLKDHGLAKDPDIRRALNQDFADYLKQKGRYEPQPNPATSFWRTFDRLAGPLGTAGARIMVQRLMEAEQSRTDAKREARRLRREGRAGQGPGPSDGGARVAR